MSTHTKLPVPEVRGLHGQFGRETGLADAAERPDVVLSDPFGGRAVGDRLAQLRDDGGHAPLVERHTSAEGGLDGLAGHEAPYGPLREGSIPDLLRKPPTLGSP
jgi:hypothetical protein